MPIIPLHPPSQYRSPPASNSLPRLIRTPSGLALLELQGTINIPPISTDDEDTEMQGTTKSKSETPIGRLVFPEYSPAAPADELSWTKRVYLYVGQYQRMTGEVKKLPKPLGVIRRREIDEDRDELEVMEVVEWKIAFRERPEPVGGEMDGKK
ncbi:MAG: hypothetical protein MMC33_000037 [Icmadophila ericetorum]|nr:hypothetical protein [Icmadophila ericetorum]